MILMGVFDFMVMCWRQAWNMSTSIHDHRYMKTNSYFCISLAEEMLAFRDESAVNVILEARLNQSALMVSSVHGMAVAQRSGKMGCCLCQLEKQF